MLIFTFGGDTLGQCQNGADHPPVLAPLDQIERLLAVEVRVGVPNPQVCRFLAQYSAQEVDNGFQFEETLRGVAPVTLATSGGSTMSSTSSSSANVAIPDTDARSSLRTCDSTC